MENKKITPADYRDAIQCQNACNSSGLIHSLDRVIDKIWDEGRRFGLGTDYVNTHPIVVLYLNALAGLAGVSGPSLSQFENAYEICEDKANG